MIARRRLVPAIRREALLVPADMRKCVAYLTVPLVDEETGLVTTEPIGTAFFVCVPAEGIAGANFVYAVTARHVVDAARRYHQLFIRINQRGGRWIDVPTPPADDWEMHPRTDVAAVPLALPLDALDTKWIPLDLLVTDELAETKQIAEGDEIGAIGLFTSHPGETRAEPVVRFGHIARMPYDEPIPIKMDPAPDGGYVPVRAYLAEAAAWGGQSGSPAFIYFAPDRVPGVIQVGGQTFGLLGLIHGHYPYEQRVAITSGEITGTGTIDLNLGISVVIPAADILTVLNSEVLMEHRKKVTDEARAKGRLPNPDSALTAGPEASEFERFEELTRKLVNTPKPKPDESES